MSVTLKARQTIPRWSIHPGAPVAQPRSATIIPLPRAAARDRRVLTYPAAIALPPRIQYDGSTAEQPASVICLLALAAPTAIAGLMCLLTQGVP